MVMFLISCSIRPTAIDINNGNGLEYAKYGNEHDIVVIKHNDGIMRKLCGQKMEVLFVNDSAVYYGRRNDWTDCNKLSELWYVKIDEIKGDSSLMQYVRSKMALRFKLEVQR